MSQRWYIAIDLKSFYASVECRERGLDPLTTNLVVADLSRTEKTICLAVSPSLKAYGISGRARLFQVVERVAQLNALRRRRAPAGRFLGSSFRDPELRAIPSLELDYIVAPPRMKLYMDYSTRIYQIYLKYIAPEDIHVYSIDEVFMDVTGYLQLYRCSPHQLASRLLQEVLSTTGITGTAGIGTNLYLSKVAMDILAKHCPPDRDGVRIAQLDEYSYRLRLWQHRPLRDFWRIGPGYQRRLEAHGLYTMGEIALCSLGEPGDYYNEDLLYRLFGINAELLIDHAWGWETCTLADIKAYRPDSSSLSSGQVLKEPYSHQRARLIVKEMADQLSLSLAKKGLVTDQLLLDIGYDEKSLSLCTDCGPLTRNHYGHTVPKPAHGSRHLDTYTASTRLLLQAAQSLYQEIADPRLLIRRITLTANHVLPPEHIPQEAAPLQQLDLFQGSCPSPEEWQRQEQSLERERRMQAAILQIQQKYGKNALFRGMNLKEGATARERNTQVGGHKAE